MISRAHSLVGFNPDGRPKDDFYRTPERATKALLSVETFSGSIWEPACGDGAISEVLIAAGHEVYSSDLIDRGYGESNHDFLLTNHRADNIITNPPYKLANEFIERSLMLTTGKVAMLLKLTALAGKERRRIFESSPFKAVYVHTGRLQMMRNGGEEAAGMIDFGWFVWEHGYTGKPFIGWL